MLARVLVIALNTYRESVRARVLLGLAGVAFAMAIYSLFVGLFTLNDAPRVVSDLGAAAISIFSIAVAVIVSATSLHRELEQKTIFPILARPVHRYEYLLGKYLGTLLTIAVFVMADAGLVLMLGAGLAGQSAALLLATGVVFCALLVVAVLRSSYATIPWAAAFLVAAALLSGSAPDERKVVLYGSLLTMLEVGIVTAVATVFASFSTPFLSALLTLGLWIVGRNADSLARLPTKQFGQALHDIGAKLAWVIPNLQVYVPARPLLTGDAIDAKIGPYLAQAAITSVAWSAGLLILASAIFKKRDFL